MKSLNTKQLTTRYPAACIERWGNENEHTWVNDNKTGIPLHCLLSPSSDPCASCGADGEQFFSFCLNRSVNSDRVKHCTYCGKCFYFRPGCLLACAHCGFGIYDPRFDNLTGEGAADLALKAGITIEEATSILEENSQDQCFPIQFVEEARGCNIPSFADPSTLGLAGEGYWGY